MLPADIVIEALGFDPEDLPRAFGAPDLDAHALGHDQDRRAR